MRTLHAEWTKLRTLSSTAWLMLGAIGLTIALSAAVVASADPQGCPRCLADPVKLSLFGVRLGQVALVVLAVLAIGNEYSTRLIHVTLTATPRRLAVYGAKLTLAFSAGVIAGGLGTVGSWLSGRRLLHQTLYDAASVRALIGTTLYFGLVAVLSAGLAAIVRDSAGAITLTLALLYLGPIIATFVSNPLWERRMQQWTPMDAGLAIQATRALDTLAIKPWHGLGVLAAYSLGLALIGGVLFQLRDA